MARGKNTQNYILKRKRNPNKSKGTDASNETLDVVLQNKYDSVVSALENISLKLYNMCNKKTMYIGMGAFLLVFLVLNFIERKITKYTYAYENISEIKYKSVYNGHYNYKGKESYETLTAMGAEGRKIYLFYNLVLIFIYSPALFVGVTNLITDICGLTKTNIMPFGISVFQILESIALVFTLLGYPNTLGLLFIAGKLAVIKYFFIFLAIFVVIFGAIDRYQNKPKPEPEAKEEEKKEEKKSN
ncbi:hypothetical protein LY90DRAFT_676798, partial [Neocallimastix californiae]|jgi:hypothetical protein